MAKRRFHKRRYRKKRLRKRRYGRFVARVINSRSTYKRWHEAWNTLSVTGAGGGATVFVSYTYPMNFFDHYTNSAGTYGVMPNVDFDYTSLLQTFFDMYRVLRLEIAYYPNDGYAVWDKALNQYDTVDHPNIMYFYYDNDDGALISSETEALNSGHKPKVISKFNKFGMNNGSRQYINASLYTTTPTTAVTQSTIALATYNFGSIKLGFPNLIQPAAGTTSVYGRIYARWLVEYKSVRVA